MIKESTILEMTVKALLRKRGQIYAGLSLNQEFQDSLERIALRLLSTIQTGGKIYIFGNGGSAAQAQHFSAELVGRFKKNRRAIPAIALTTDTSILTAQANDAGYETVFERQIKAICNSSDAVIGLTTSDISGEHSANISKGFLAAKEVGAYTLGIFSRKTSLLLERVDDYIIAPARDTEIIQEIHLMIVHILCELIENQID